MSVRASGTAGLPLDDAALDEATAHYARPRESEAARDASMLVFRIGSEWLALSTRVLDRVASVQRVHSLPHRRGGTAAGLVNVGGDLVVHLSLAGVLRLAPSPAVATGGAELPRLVVLVDLRGRVATTVDQVWGIHHYHASDLRAVPQGLARADSSFTNAILQLGERSVGCLDETRVMDALSMELS